MEQNKNIHTAETPLVEVSSCRLTESALGLVYRVEPHDLRAPTRHQRKTAFARHLAIYLAHVGFGLDYTKLGMAFGRDRTTVRYACTRIEDARDSRLLDVGLQFLEKSLVQAHRAWCLSHDCLQSQRGCV